MNRAVRSVVATLVLAAGIAGVRPAGAAEGFTYGTATTSRAIETYANIPAEVNQGTPSTTVPSYASLG